MTSPSHYTPLHRLPALSPSVSPLPSTHHNDSPDATTAPHPDFLGAPPQDSPYPSQGALGLSLHSFDPHTSSYAFALDEPALSSSVNVSDDTATDHFSSAWSTSPQYNDASLFPNDSAFIVGISSPSPPSASTLPPLAEGYFPHDSRLFNLYNSRTGHSRPVPDIHVQTEWSQYSPSGGDSQSSFFHSPNGQPATLTPISHVYSPHSPSPSSIGSAPPFTPESPCETRSLHGSPYIKQPSVSPISPAGIAPPFDTFDPTKETQLSAMQPMQRERSVLEIADNFGHPLGGPLVPQSTYRPHTLSDRRRYVEEVNLEEPIMFYTHGPTGCGIRLQDAIASKFSNLINRDDAMFEGRGPSVSIRLNWPGYLPWSRQIPTRDFRSPPHPITRAKLARNVAKTIDRFIKDMNEKPQTDGDLSKLRWRVGPNGIRLEDLMLVGLQHVSMGSWQAHVRLIRRH